MTLPGPDEDWLDEWLQAGDGRTLAEFYAELALREEAAHRQRARQAEAAHRTMLLAEMLRAMEPFGIGALQYSASKQEYTAIHHSGKTINFRMDDTPGLDREQYARTFTRRFLLAYKVFFPEIELDPTLVQLPPS